MIKIVQKIIAPLRTESKQHEKATRKAIAKMRVTIVWTLQNFLYWNNENTKNAYNNKKQTIKTTMTPTNFSILE